MRFCFLLVFIAVFTFSNISFAQSNSAGWHLRSPEKDSIYGINISDAYIFLQGRQSTPITVAVIDSGIDTVHEDLKKILWHNTGEIAGNNLDDDHNGYIDDIYGWNFLGNKNGNNQQEASSEKARIYYRYKDTFINKDINEDSLTTNKKWIYEEWKKAAAEMNVSQEEEMEVMMFEMIVKTLNKSDGILQHDMNKDVYTIDELEKYEPKTSSAKQAKLSFITFLKMQEIDATETNESILNDLEEYTNGKRNALDAKNAAPPDLRAAIIGDDENNIEDRNYGNNDVMGTFDEHGTHVAGIIAAQRNNNIGIDGVADNVKIMMLRAIPEGDEYDKDIALAIRYAVDNGAKIINMSFGKRFSAHKDWVDDAVLYAAQHDVLLVCAAGNSSENTDTIINFPNATIMATNTISENFISVGASGDTHIEQGKMIAYFSNYGKNTVDVFAPGVKMYSTLPGGNKYGFLQGTSMSAPVVTGVAALIRSYFPQLTAIQVKEAIEKTVTHLPESASLVNRPGDYTSELVPITDLCKSGGIINAASSLEFAADLKPVDAKLKTEVKKKGKSCGVPLTKKN